MKVHHVPPGRRKAACGRYPGDSPSTHLWKGVSCEQCKAQKPHQKRSAGKSSKLLFWQR